MNQRFTLDRKSFEQFLAALSLVQQLKKQTSGHRQDSDADQPLLSLLQLQRAISSGTLAIEPAMSAVVQLAKSVTGASSAGIWLFRDENEFSCRAQVGSLYDPQRLGGDILAHLASSNQPDSNSFPISRSLRKASHYPGYPNSLAIAALRVNGKITGAIAAFSSSFDAFVSRDLENLHFIGGLLEQALHQAVQEGYRDAVALEHSALLQSLEAIAPRLRELERHLRSRVRHSASERKPEPFVERNPEPFPLPEENVYPKPFQLADDPKQHAEQAPVIPTPVEAKPEDISLYGVGVRSALGDVREFTGDEEPSFFLTAIRRVAGGAASLAAIFRSGIGNAKTKAVASVRASMTRSPRLPDQVTPPLAQSSTAPVSAVTASDRKPFHTLPPLKVRLHLPQLRKPALPLAFLRNAGTASANLWHSTLASTRSLAARANVRFQRSWRETTLHLRSLRKDFRQANADMSAAVAHHKVRMRIAQRRQQSRLSSSAGTTGKALQHAASSLADVASSAGQSTLTVLHAARTGMKRIPKPVFERRALRRSVGALAVLAVMAAFVVLQASVRHSSPSHAASAATSAPASEVGGQLVAATTSSQAKPGPTSHLEITDAAVADTLHDLTRYEIVTLPRAAEYGDDDAAFQLGMAYETGYYVRQNCAKAAHWVKVAAEAGNSAAAYNLALRYRNGDGLPPDDSAADHWLRMASAHKYSPAKLAAAAAGQ